MKFLPTISITLLFIVGLFGNSQSVAQSVNQIEPQRQVKTVITPSEVYSIWININKLLLDYAEIKGVDDATLSEIKILDIKEVTGKVPANVFSLVGEFGKDFVYYSDIKTTTHGDDLLHLEGRIIGTLQATEKEVIPAMVFARSMVLLDVIMQSFIQMDNKNYLLSPYYKLGEIENKTPSDVFALVNLARDRLHLLTLAERPE